MKILVLLLIIEKWMEWVIVALDSINRFLLILVKMDLTIIQCKEASKHQREVWLMI
jgi:hypothetical protein